MSTPSTASGELTDAGRQPYGELNPDYHDHSAHYIKIWGFLVLLLIASVIGPVIGDLTGLKIITLITAFGIAVVKAAMVCKEFMHINQEPAIVHYFLITALVFMALFFGAVAPDVMNHRGSNWVNVAAEREIALRLAEAAANPDGHHGGDHGAGDASDEAGAHGGGH